MYPHFPPYNYLPLACRPTAGHKEQQDLVVSQLQTAFGAGCVSGGIRKPRQKEKMEEKRKGEKTIQ